ncbi:MAG TPA: OmpA family protein [Candidatus Kapabacteria bacterium]|jgi:outer membrane protein OmpA-like peptidoglycan-associated protein|nr:OmpA family protein [Ignavibacteria bacterium]MBN8574599.1 OmpA family protein [Candidatus Kapabacteria bacterium]HRE57494.1 OmpA family protein [Candidatus Kapabacteria bacterium]HRK59999.1 OmpA family protein [Candidatus Kapabacteria bacterium]
MKKILTLVLTLSSLFFSHSLFAQINVVVSVTGTVLKANDRNPASVNITFYDSNNKRVGSSRSNAKDGYYLVTGLKPGETYKVKIEHPDFFQEEVTVSTPRTSKYSELSRDFLVKPLISGIRLPLPVTPFELNKSKLRVGSEEFLAETVEALLMNPSVKVQISSYPDEMESKEANIKLTRERCETLKAFFVAKGVSADRISIVPSENADPINPPPMKKAAKGKRYIGSTYIVVTKI